MTEKFTLSEVLALFGRPAQEARRIGSVDSEEYLTLVTYLVSRSSRFYQGTI